MKIVNLVDASGCRNWLEGLIQKTGSWIFRKHFIVVESENEATYVTGNSDYLFYCENLEDLGKMLIAGSSVCIRNDVFLKFNGGSYQDFKVNLKYRLILNDLLPWQEKCLNGMKKGYIIDALFLSLFDSLAIVCTEKSFVNVVEGYCVANRLKLNLVSHL